MNLKSAQHTGVILFVIPLGMKSRVPLISIVSPQLHSMFSGQSSLQLQKTPSAPSLMPHVCVCPQRLHHPFGSPFPWASGFFFSPNRYQPCQY